MQVLIGCPFVLQFLQTFTLIHFYSILAKRHGLEWRKLNRFANLQAALNCTIQEMVALTDKLLTKDLYSRDDVLCELEITDADLEDTILSKNTRHLQSFKIRQRALHVIQGTAQFILISFVSFSHRQL